MRKKIYFPQNQNGANYRLLYQRAHMIASTNDIGQKLNELLRVYVINLPSATERWENMKAELEPLHLPYTRIGAVQGDDLKEPIVGYNERKYNILTGKVTNKREVGCYLSHMKALREFLQTDQPYALILEDDAILPDNIVALLSAAIEKNELWDMVRLTAEKKGVYLPAASLPDDHQLAYNTRRLKSTAAYIVNRHAAQCVVDKMLPMRLPYDVALDRDWDFGFRTACLVPFPVKLATDTPSQIPRAKRIRLYRSTTFHLFHYLTYFERRIHRYRQFLETRKIIKRQKAV